MEIIGEILPKLHAAMNGRALKNNIRSLFEAINVMPISLEEALYFSRSL